MKNERENIVRPLPAEKPTTPDEFSFDAVIKKQSKEIIIKDFASKLKTKPSAEKIDKASDVLNSFRMGLFSGYPTSLEQALRIDQRINSILTEPTKIDASRNKRNSKKTSPKKAA